MGGDRHENAPVSHSPSNRQLSPTFDSPHPNDSSMLRTLSLQATLAAAHEQIRQSLLEQSLLEQSLLEQSLLEQSSREASDRTSVPPASFFANALVPFLLPLGPSLFDDRSKANCILNTRGHRFYVHVQMLSARSPVFQQIFDEMVVNGAWGDEDSDDEDGDEDKEEEDDEEEEENDDEGDGDYEEDEGDYEEYDDDYDEDDDPDNQFPNDGEDKVLKGQDQSLSRGPTGNHQEGLRVLNVTWRKRRTKSKQGQDQRRDYGRSGDDVDDVEEEGGDDDYGADYDHDLDLPEISDPYMDADDDECDEYGELEEKDEEEDEEEDEEDSADDDDDYPELIMDFADPEGSRFKELLYWLYTDDGPRWLDSFTPQNYEDILKNIVTLCILTPTVLSICQTFEESTNPNLGLRGLASRAMKQVPISKSTTMVATAATTTVTGRGGRV